jgi:hypothetical protein
MEDFNTTRHTYSYFRDIYLRDSTLGRCFIIDDRYSTVNSSHSKKTVNLQGYSDTTLPMKTRCRPTSSKIFLVFPSKNDEP